MIIIYSFVKKWAKSLNNWSLYRRKLQSVSIVLTHTLGKSISNTKLKKLYTGLKWESLPFLWSVIWIFIPCTWKSWKNLFRNHQQKMPVMIDDVIISMISDIFCWWFQFRLLSATLDTRYDYWRHDTILRTNL